MNAAATTIWPTKYTVERITVEFDFGADLAAGDAVVSTELELTCVLGTDAAPQALLSGAAQIKGARVFQQLQAGLAGCNYRVTCKATTTNNNLLVLSRVLPVRTV